MASGTGTFDEILDASGVALNGVGAVNEMLGNAECRTLGVFVGGIGDDDPPTTRGVRVGEAVTRTLDWALIETLGRGKGLAA